MYWLVVDGIKRPVHTFLSHGVREYGDSLLGKMAQQLRLRRPELDALVECPLDGHALRPVAEGAWRPVGQHPAAV
jgi:hypothetical protein